MTELWPFSVSEKWFPTNNLSITIEDSWLGIVNEQNSSIMSYGSLKCQKSGFWPVI